MCRIARHTIGNYPHCRNIHNKIDGGAFSLSSSPRLITYIYIMQTGSKPRTLHLQTPARSDWTWREAVPDFPPGERKGLLACDQRQRSSRFLFPDKSWGDEYLPRSDPILQQCGEVLFVYYSMWRYHFWVWCRWGSREKWGPPIFPQMGLSPSILLYAPQGKRWH